LADWCATENADRRGRSSCGSLFYPLVPSPCVVCAFSRKILTTTTVAAVAVFVIVALGLRLKHAQADEISLSAYAFNAGGRFLFSKSSTALRATAGQTEEVTCTTTGAAVTVLSED
jgi:hypothetical protein